MLTNYFSELCCRQGLLFSLRLTGVCLVLAVPAVSSEVHAAAPVPITQSGLNTQVSTPLTLPNGQTQYNITGGTRPGGGTNLFHSFGNFNIPTNNIANFLNDSGLATSNILGRVTGGNPSSIFGMIQTTGFGNANLFLMNPAGFLFGPNATLNVGGMVAFTTADYLRLADGVRFNAIPNAAGDALLSPAPVAAFGFLGANPAAIAIQGSTLTVAQGQTLSLIGGNKGFIATDPDTGNPIPVPGGITMTGGKLVAPGGQINMVSVAGPGEISAVDFMQTTGMAMGNISLSQGALLDVSADAAGTVRIRGGQLMMADATISADTNNTNGAPTAVDINVTGDMTITDTRGLPAITARTTGTGDAGAVQILSGNLTATSSFLDPHSLPSVLIDSHTSGDGRGGDIHITTGSLDVSGTTSNSFNFIDSGTAANGRGGDVTINAETVNFTSASISTGQLVASATAPDPLSINGNGGNLTITADTIQFNNSILDSTAVLGLSNFQNGGNITIQGRNISMTGTQIDTSGIETGGSISLKAEQLVTSSTTFQTYTFFEQGGSINLQAKSVELTNGSALISTTFADGNAGNIIVNATDHVNIVGDTGTDPRAITRPSGIFSNSFGTFTLVSSGNSGNVIVTTPTLQMVGGRINTVTESSGQGGNVILNISGSLSISGEFPTSRLNISSSIFDIGPLAPSGIVTSTVGNEFCAGPCGNAGSIALNTGSLLMSAGSQINSGTSSTGSGGLITISATNVVSMAGHLTDGSPVGIFSRSTGSATDAGAGGNISLSAGQSVNISNGATVSASTTGPGNAGNILVKANDITINGGATITAASTGAGNAGTVTIQGLNSPANSFLVDGAGSGVFTNTEATGAGGNILVNADTVTISNGGTLSAKTSGTAPSATGGTITIEAPNTVTLTSGATITASSTGPANTGNIQINAGNEFAMTNSTMTTEATQSGGGLIKITTNPGGGVQLTNSTISASVLDGTGGGGSVNIDPQFVILQNSQILANAVFGPGGNISITTNLLLPDTASVISASSQFGQQGTISIQSPISPASGKILPLSNRPLIATSLTNQRCAALAGGNFSSFTVAGRDSLPAEPGGWLSTPLALASSEPGGGTLTKFGSSLSEGESGEKIPLLSLRHIAPPGFLTQTFAVESSAGCTS